MTGADSAIARARGWAADGATDGMIWGRLVRDCAMSLEGAAEMVSFHREELRAARLAGKADLAELVGSILRGDLNPSQARLHAILKTAEHRLWKVDEAVAKTDDNPRKLKVA